jgi:mitochondrial fission protein ELM1
VVLDAQSVENLKLLIISDGKKGHENQSIAYASLLGSKYEICYVSYTSSWKKMLSYVFDFFGLHVKIFRHEGLPKESFDAIVCAGSTTYYPAKFFKKKLNIPIIALMLPRGYRLKDFKHIFAMVHDNPPKKPNITPLHVNICQNDFKGIFKALKPTVGVIIGGSNSNFTCKASEIRKHLNLIEQIFPESKLAITTSPRTPLDVENLIEQTECEFKIIYSKNPKNPVGDFLNECQDVCITQDSTSMLSQAVCWGKAKIHIMPLKSTKKDNKYHQFANFLVENGYATWLGKPLLHVKKYDLVAALKKELA